MQTKFFTNQEDNSLLKKFEGVFSNVESIRHFDALVGYFRASGYFKVRPFLEKIPKIRILVGINVDNLIKSYYEQGKLYLANEGDVKDDFIEDMIRNIQEAEYDETIEKGIIQFISDIISDKIELRTHPSKKIHAKVYIFKPEPFNEYAPCEVITGSSNLTDSGLGSNPESNYEFNVSLRDYQDVKFASDEFERLWDESIPILKAEANRIKDGSYIGQEYTPFELYVKMLIEYFGVRVEYDPYNIDLLLPPKYFRLKYQSDAANQGYSIMMKHNGFMLADVVGLGKTIIACMIIKKFIYENGTRTKVLVVVPPAIEDNWRRTVKDFELENHFSFITTGSIDKILDRENYQYPNPEEIDMIIIDESHKFRNDYTDMYLALQEVCKKPRIRPAENGDRRKKIILISATPLNNRPQDIENQLYLFQDKRDSTIEGVRNLQEFFKPVNKQYENISKELKKLDYENEEDKIKRKKLLKQLKELFQYLRDNVVEQLVIRRTRTDIENGDYNEDMTQQGLKFPKVYKGEPITIKYKLDGNLSKLFFDTVSLITSIDEFKNKTDGLKYYRYRLIEFLINDKDKKIYGDVKSISARLEGIMKTLLVKRLESSFFAFKQSLRRLKKANDNMIKMFEDNRIFIAPDLDINLLLEEGKTYEQIETAINDKKGNNKEFKKDDFDSKYIKLLKEDKKKINVLLKKWEKVVVDPKLEEFKENIKNVFFSKSRNIGGKLIIFTESKETAEELYSKLIDISNKRVLNVSSDNRKSLDLTIRDNFDANLEKDKWQNDYDVIITTEVLAEGINLHRSNVVVNYDVPWNSTRLMQRIGRVNRIGSEADFIYVYNYYPSAHGDALIHLVDNALRKLQAFHTAFGEDNKIFSYLEEKGEGALFGNKIKEETNEIEQYLFWLRDFKKHNEKKFSEISKIKSKASCTRYVVEDKNLNISEIEHEEINYPLSRTTITYLKSDNHPGVFCFVTPEMRTLEINFLKAAKLFEAKAEEKFSDTKKLHYDQTKKALAFFKSEANQENIQTADRRHMSPAENKALTNLDSLLKHVNTEQKRKILLFAKDIIRKGTYASKGLPKDINKLFTDNLELLGSPEKLIDKLFLEVLDRYEINATEDKASYNRQSIINPRIVITESFINRE